jgi:hypothetical protein
MSPLVISTAAVTLPPTLNASAPTATTIAGEGRRLRRACDRRWDRPADELVVDGAMFEGGTRILDLAFVSGSGRHRARGERDRRGHPARPEDDF